MVSKGGSGVPFQVIFAIGGVDKAGQRNGGGRILEHLSGGFKLRVP